DFGATITASRLGVRADGTVTLFDDGNNVATFAAVTNGGTVSLQDLDNVTVGSIAAYATPTLFAATAGIMTTGGGASGADVLLLTGPDGAPGDGSLAINAAISAGTGTVRISADGDVSQLGAITASTLGVRTSSGDVSLLAANDVDVFAALTAGGSVSFSDLDDVTVGTVPALFEFDETIFPVTSGIVTSGGDVTLIAGHLTVVEAITSGGGDILLQVDGVDLQAAVDATNAGLVQVTPRTDGRGITLGGAGGLSLDFSEINQITARLLAIGGVDVDVTASGTAASAGRITIAGTLAPTNVQNLSFLTEADVFGSTVNSIDVAGAIVFDVGTGVSGLGGSDGTFLAVSASDIAGRVRGTGEFRVSSFGNTVVGLAVPLDPIAIAGTAATGLTGVTTQNGTIALEALGGSLTVAADLAVQGVASDVILNAVGANSDLILNASVSSDRSVLMFASRDVVQSSATEFVTAAGVRLVAGRNIGTAAAPIDLRAGTVAAFSFGGSLFINEDVEGGGLAVGTVAGVSGLSAPGLVHVTTEADNLAVGAAVNGGQVLLESGTAGAGSTLISAAVSAAGSVEINSSSQLSSTAAGTISGSIAELTAVDLVSLNGTVTTTGHTTIVSTAAGVGIAAATVGGPLTIAADGGNIDVNGDVHVGGLIDFDAAARIGVAPGGSLTGSTIDLLAGGLISLGGPIHAAGNATAVSTGGGIAVSASATAGGNFVANAMVGSVAITSAVIAGGTLDIDAGGGLTVFSTGSLTGHVVDLHANGSISLRGSLKSTADTTIVSVEAGIGIAKATVGGQLVVDAGGAGINVTDAILVTGSIDFDAAGGIGVASGGSLQGSNIDLTAVGPISLAGNVQSGGNVTAVSANGGIAVAAPLTAGGSFVADAQGGAVSVSGPVVVGGLIDVDATTAIGVAPGGSLRGSAIDLAAGTGVSLAGALTSAGNLTAATTGGNILVSSNLTSGGMLRLVANTGSIFVNASGELVGRQINLAAGGQANIQGRTFAAFDVAIASASRTIIGGAMTAGTTIAINSSGALDVGAPMAAGGLVRLQALGSMSVMVGGSIVGAIVDVAAHGVVIVAGPVASHTALAVQSISSRVEVVAPLSAGAGLDIVAGGGNLTLRAAATAGAHARLIAAGDLVVAGGSVVGHLVSMIGAGTTVVAGRVDATLDAAILSGTGGLTIGGPVTAGRTIAMLSGGGNLLLDGNVTAGQSAVLQSPNGSVLQPSTIYSVVGPAAAIMAGGSVGRAGEAIDLAVGQIAATAAGGGAWLNQQAAGGTLTIAILGAERGVRSPHTVAVSTENGDLVLAAPVMGSTIALTANRVVGSAGRGRVLFDRGYAETPTGRIVGSPPQNIPVDANGVPITRFDLASPFVVTFGIIAGNVANTVDGVLGDRGVTVTVDFVQPEIFDPVQSRFQSMTDRSGSLVEDVFGPFSFQYSELFLQERLILSGAREQLFNIIITASQDNSISIAEQIDGVTVVDPTRQTVTFGNVSTSPTEQSLSIPLGVVSPVLASIDVPESAEPDR
ncbi:MAG: hypothetical protein WBC44_21235, partial [Planctomycetaceae bacterium]